MKESDEERFQVRQGKSVGLVSDSDSGLKLSTIEVFEHVNNKQLPEQPQSTPYIEK